MSVCQLRIGDGRDDVHERSAASLEEMLPKPDKLVVVDDRDHELGFAGAVAEGWRKARDSGCEFVWHAEMDFIYHQPVPLDRMIGVLKRHPSLVQMALMRQPCNPEEEEAGGVVARHERPEPPGTSLMRNPFTQRTERGDIWTEHRIYFTTNPSVYPIGLCYQPWPQEAESEGKFTLRLLEDPEAQFGFWGAKYDAPLVEHIGVREGVGY